MPEQKLKNAILQLEEALKGLKPTDGESRKRLQHLIELLKEKLNAPQPNQGQVQLLETLKEKTVYFENAHPLIGRILGEIIGILTRMGI